MSKTTAETQPSRKVLIVEDEGDMCLLLNIILTGKNLELDHVKNLKAAAEYLQQEQPSVVILDNKLPDGFGIDYIPLKTWPWRTAQTLTLKSPLRENSFSMRSWTS
jgi:two-component system, OmpR family, response regulator